MTTDGTNSAAGASGAAAAEFAPVERIDGAPARGLVLVCDHAANLLPAAYGTLGLHGRELDRHIGYDIGAAAVTRALAERLGAPAVLSRFSRLLIDPNRAEDDPTLIMRLSDGAVVPGNAAIDDDERARRISLYYRPYHDAVAAAIDAGLAAGTVPAILSVHSFTPDWRGFARPWHAGVLWDADPRLARPLIAALRAEPGLVIGDNEPYSGRLRGDTLYRHGTSRGLAHALVELRQDLIGDAAGIKEWAGRLAGVLERLIGQADLHRIGKFGSHSDRERPAADRAQRKGTAE